MFNFTSTGFSLFCICLLLLCRSVIFTLPASRCYMSSGFSLSHVLRLLLITCPPASRYHMSSGFSLSHVFRLLVITCPPASRYHVFSGFSLSHVFRLLVITCLPASRYHMSSGFSLSHVLRLLVITCLPSSVDVARTSCPERPRYPYPEIPHLALPKTPKFYQILKKITPILLTTYPTFLTPVFPSLAYMSRVDYSHTAFLNRPNLNYQHISKLATKYLNKNKSFKLK